MTLTPERRHFFAIFAISLAILVLEITVARILSVALFSHYAFVAISLAMFGLGLSGLVVYLFPARFPPQAIDRQLRTFASLFGLTAALSVLAFLHIRVVQELSLAGFLTLGLAYAALTVPFFLGGICISLLMTHFSAQIARIYYADLVGASLGCLAVVAALQLWPAPRVALLVAFLVTAAALVFAAGARPRALALPGTALAVTAALLALALTTNAYTMRFVKNHVDFYSSYAAWNAFSRVSAFEMDRNAAQILPLKNPAQDYAGDEYPKTMMLDIDGAAWTPMMGYKGDLSSIQFLRESVLYVVHHLKAGGDVLVIGTGGGRDLLAAAAFGQPSVLGIEINPLMREIVQGRYGDYTGHPYTLPGTEVIIDEARSRLSSINRRFDVIQLSLIDTLSLNVAGGFVFSENYLYTTEAFREYFLHLTNDGILNLTRYFMPRYPLEILRLTTIARAAWEAEGVTRFADHAVMLAQGMNGSLLVKRSPYTAAELESLRAIARENKMRLLYVPGETSSEHADIVSVITSPTWREYIAGHEFLIHPPTDDRPFFFNFLRGTTKPPSEEEDFFLFLNLWNEALVLIYMLIAVVTVLAVLFFFGPLLLFARQRTHHVGPSVAAPLLLYFACLGYGFMIIEIPLMQRFMLFLGYPVYALAVVLFAILLFSGIGSLTSARFADNPKAALLRVLVAIIIIAVIYVLLLPPVITALLGLPIVARIVLTVVLLAPLGLVLGMAYPLGITVLRRFGEELVPWAWGLNGALSVVASVLATFIGSRIGFSAALLTGVAAYGLGFVLIVVGTRFGENVGSSRA